MLDLNVAAWSSLRKEFEDPGSRVHELDVIGVTEREILNNDGMRKAKKWPGRVGLRFPASRAKKTDKGGANGSRGRRGQGYRQGSREQAASHKAYPQAARRRSIADNVAEPPARKRPAACVVDVPPSGSKMDDPQTLGKAAVTSAQRSSWASVVGHWGLKDPPPTS